MSTSVSGLYNLPIVYLHLQMTCIIPLSPDNPMELSPHITLNEHFSGLNLHPVSETVLQQLLILSISKASIDKRGDNK